MRRDQAGDAVNEAYWIVASTIFFGNSSEPTSPPTAKASPPAALISSTTIWAFFSSRLQRNVRYSHLERKNRGLLADHDLSSFFGEKESSTPSNALDKHHQSIIFIALKFGEETYLRGTYGHIVSFG